MKTKKEPPLLSILMASYNNAVYLPHAIESCIGQKTSFPFQLIISDDNSTDGSKEILDSFAARYPNIHIIHHTINCIQKNYTDMFNAARTKYVAFCDGDDFWTDEHKLEKQVCFLEANPDFTVCAHKTDVLIEGYEGPDFPKPIHKRDPSTLTREQGIMFADELADNYYLHISSYVFRWRYTNGLPANWKTFMTNDHFMLMVHAAEGKIKYLDETMSVWRRHNNSYTWLQTRKPSLYVRERWEQFLELQKKMDEYFEGRFRYQLLERVRFALHCLVKECEATGDKAMLQFFVCREAKYFNIFNDKYGKLVDAARQISKYISPDATSIYTNAILPPPDIEHPRESSSTRAIGGMIPLDLDSIPPCADSVWSSWIKGREFIAFSSPQGALAALIWSCASLRVWIPSYYSLPLREACRNRDEFKILFYDITDGISYDSRWLGAVQPGDIVITPRFFGRGLPDDLCRKLHARKDIAWIEDCSYSLDASASPAHWKFYSPSHILGVPDGGIIVGEGLSQWLSLPEVRDDATLTKRFMPSILNFENPGRAFAQGTTLPAEQSYLPLSRETMSRMTRALLERISYKTVSGARKKNWKLLYERLAEYALWKLPEPDFTPSAFPIVVPENNRACRLASFLSDEGLLCSPPYDLTVKPWASPLLFERLAVLPCDHCYNDEDMRRLAKAVNRLLA